jgi:hypothetical protein
MGQTPQHQLILAFFTKNHRADRDNSSLDDKRQVVDSLIVVILATSENVEIEWKI